MSWAYLQCPPDGAVFLSWQPLAQRGLRFASDGYVWADAESTYNYDVRGYVSVAWPGREGFGKSLILSVDGRDIGSSGRLPNRAGASGQPL